MIHAIIMLFVLATVEILVRYERKKKS